MFLFKISNKILYSFLNFIKGGKGPKIKKVFKIFLCSVLMSIIYKKQGKGTLIRNIQNTGRCIIFPWVADRVPMS